MSKAITPTAKQPPTHVIAKRKYIATAAVGDAAGLKGLLDMSRESIAQALPRHVSPERLIKTMLVAANRTPDLYKCTQASLIETISRAAELGLDLSGTLGEAYPVPFNNTIEVNGKDQKVKQCQLIIGYKGLAKLARQSGEISRIEADVVREHDDFTFKRGLHGVLDFTPNMGDRGEVIGAYALVQFKDGGVQFDFMTKREIEKIRNGSMSKNSPAWKNHWDEMAKKTVFRRVAKWLPLSAEKWEMALAHDNATSGMADIPNVLAVERAGLGTRSDKLLSDMKGAGAGPKDTPGTDDDENPDDDTQGDDDAGDDAQEPEGDDAEDEQEQPDDEGEDDTALSDAARAWRDAEVKKIVRECGCTAEAARDALVEWMGTEGAEPDDLNHAKTRRALDAALAKGVDWEQHV